MALRAHRAARLVIVQALDLDLQTGFTVLTGETGAGKSILIDACWLAAGRTRRQRRDPRRAERTDISAEFDIGPQRC